MTAFLQGDSDLNREYDRDWITKHPEYVQPLKEGQPVPVRTYGNSGRFRSTRPLALLLLGLFAFLALFALVIFAFLALCALVLFAFLALCALVLFAFLALFALFLFALIALLALVLFALIALFALVLFALIALFALVPCAFRTLLVVDDHLLTCASRVSCTLGFL